MSRSPKKNQVFMGRKAKMPVVTEEQRRERDLRKIWYFPDNSPKNLLVKKKTKTQRKALRKLTDSFKDRRQQNKQVKEHIGASMIYALIERLTEKGTQP